MNAVSDWLTQARTQIQELSAADTWAMLQAPGAPWVVDVREPDETAEGFLPDARLVPRGLLEFRALQFMPEQERPIVVYCASGNRSLLAALTLKSMGYTSVYSLKGGINQWVQQGLPLITPSLSTAEHLTPVQKQRYQRQLNLVGVGEAGQLKLQKARVLIVGAGGLGSPAALYLAAAGVGTLGLMDADRVSLGNLHRQIVHATDKVGQFKVDSAREMLFRLNPEVQVLPYPVACTPETAANTIKDYDLVLDGSDNFATKYLLNEVCYQLKKTWIYASLYQFEGELAVFAPHEGHACYRCLLPAPPPPELAPSCMEAGVLGVVPGILGLLQATEALKLLLGYKPFFDQVLLYEALSCQFRTLQLKPQPHCPLGHNRAG